MPYAFCEQIGKEIRDISDEIPFEIPDSWEWCRLKNIVNAVSARRVHQSDWQNSGIPFYRAREIAQLAEYGFVDNELFISEELYAEYSQSGVPNCGDLMITAVGTLGKTYIVKSSDRFYYKDASVICLENYGKVSSEYLKYLIMSPYMETSIKDNSSGTTVGTITLVRANEYLLPIPPLVEQHRIVAKIEELLPYIERYGKAEEQLTALNTTFPEALKKSILQEAVQGKLVLQNPDDEPASVLLERIRAEKQALIKAGKIKKDKHESVIVTRDKIPYEIIDGKERCIADEVPFEIPDSWCWCRLGQIYNIHSSKRIHANEYVKEGVPFFRSLEVVSLAKDIEPNISYYISKERYDEISRDNIMPQEDDLLITCIGGSIGWTWIVDDRVFYYKDGNVVAFDGHDKCDIRYIKMYLSSTLFLNQVKNDVSGTAYNALTIEMLKSSIIPLPPLAEQKRIVSKIEEIMPYINTISK